MTDPERAELEVAANQTRERLLRNLERLARRKSELLDLRYPWRAVMPWARRHKGPLTILLGSGLLAATGLASLSVVRWREARRHPLRRRAKVALAVWKNPEALLRQPRHSWLLSAIALQVVALSALDVAAFFLSSRGAAGPGSAPAR